MQKNGKPAFLPIFNKKKRPRQTLMAHPSNTTEEVDAKQCKTFMNNGQHKPQYQQSQGNQGNRVYQGKIAGSQGNLTYQGKSSFYQDGPSYQGNQSYCGNVGGYQSTGPGNQRPNYSQSQPNQKHFIKTENNLNAGGNMQISSQSHQANNQHRIYSRQQSGSYAGGGMQNSSRQPANQHRNLMYSNQPSSSSSATSSQWQMGEAGPSHNQNRTSKYRNSNQIVQTRAQPAKPDAANTAKMTRAGKEHLAKDTLRFIIASIQNVRHWTKYKNQVKIIFEVYAQLDSMVTIDASKNARIFTLKDSKSSLKCIFYEIDRCLPKFTRGQWLRCVGTLGEKKDTFHCVQVRGANENELCTRAVRMSAATKALAYLHTEP
ncbi:uncharacterized protein [Antedon mediterranea]|uniref:uncharacterized protein isoform X2 n=1 Tax=Antedon mediterranea TaxID=105859 RepID=UPI003AF51569